MNSKHLILLPLSHSTVSLASLTQKYSYLRLMVILLSLESSGICQGIFILEIQILPSFISEINTDEIILLVISYLLQGQVRQINLESVFQIESILDYFHEISKSPTLFSSSITLTLSFLQIVYLNNFKLEILMKFKCLIMETSRRFVIKMLCYVQKKLQKVFVKVQE